MIPELFAQLLEPICFQDHRSWKMPERNFPLSITDEEGGILFDHIVRNNLSSGFEVATGFGVSACWIGSALRQTNGRLFTIDNYIEEACNNHDYRERQFETQSPLGLEYAARLLSRFSLSDIVTLVRGNSPDDIPMILDGQEVDFVFIDGNHNAPYPLKDSEAIFPYLAERYIVAFHDNQSMVVPQAIDWFSKESGIQPIVYPTRYKLTLFGKGVDIARPDVPSL